MEINANIKWSPVNGVAPANNRPVNGAPPAPENDSFASSTALEGSLHNTPDVRPEAVAAGQALVNKDGYPPADTIKKLSSFLADHLANLD